MDSEAHSCSVWRREAAPGCGKTGHVMYGNDLWIGVLRP